MEVNRKKNEPDVLCGLFFYHFFHDLLDVMAIYKVI